MSQISHTESAETEPRALPIRFLGLLVYRTKLCPILYILLSPRFRFLTLFSLVFYHFVSYSDVDRCSMLVPRNANGGPGCANGQNGSVLFSVHRVLSTRNFSTDFFIIMHSVEIISTGLEVGLSR